MRFDSLDFPLRFKAFKRLTRTEKNASELISIKQNFVVCPKNVVVCLIIVYYKCMGQWIKREQIKKKRILVIL